MSEAARPWSDPTGHGRMDTDGLEWWASDPYPTWYRWADGALETRHGNHRYPGNTTTPLPAAPWAPQEEHDPIDQALLDELAQAIHEGDWMMARQDWPWHKATTIERQDAYGAATEILTLLSAHAASDAPTDPATLRPLIAGAIETHWSNRPKHGAPRRVEAKTDKALRILRSHVA